MEKKTKIAVTVESVFYDHLVLRQLVICWQNCWNLWMAVNDGFHLLTVIEIGSRPLAQVTQPCVHISGGVSCTVKWKRDTIEKYYTTNQLLAKDSDEPSGSELSEAVCTLSPIGKRNASFTLGDCVSDSDIVKGTNDFYYSIYIEQRPQAKEI